MKKYITLPILCFLITSCGASNPEPAPSQGNNDHREVVYNCALKLKEMNEGSNKKIKREASYNVDVQPGALMYPALFVYSSYLLYDVVGEEIENKLIQYTSPQSVFPGSPYTYSSIDFIENNHCIVYFANELTHSEETYLYYQIFDCVFDSTSKQMTEFVYFNANEYGNPLFSEWEYINGVYNIYYKRSEDDEVLQIERYQELASYYSTLLSTFSTRLQNKKVCEGAIDEACSNSIVDAARFLGLIQ